MEGKHHRTDSGEHVIAGVAWTRMVAVMVAAMLGVVGFFAANAAVGGAARSSGTVSLHKTSLGMILVAANGRTLYLFGKDRNDKSACSASCAQFWPPLLTRGKPTAGAGVEASLLGTTKRSNGSLQVTYNKHPLYGFLLDKSAGQTNGQGLSKFGAKWYALSAKGTAIVKTAPTGTTSTPTPTTTTSPYP
jgi:predicted lipoprotein with Yx(FWY)xxD motif